ncbi:MAG: class II glutamine amidotransferase [Candidatus Marsarchaeota archaeon]|nr:class II glutamine amidotransferase [Candidatus Marsarchaeota archaeon]
MKSASSHEMIFDSKYSILKQSKSEGHRDGWGFVSFDGNRADFSVKQTSPLEETWNGAKRAIKDHDSTCSAFFVRDASNPLNLNKSSILTIEATQPFVQDNTVFMHNGKVLKPDKLMQELGPGVMRPISKNDSEVYMILLMKMWKESKDAKTAFIKTEKFICDAYERNKGPGDEPDAYSSLNCVVTDGARMYVFNRYKRQYLKGLIKKDRDYYKMAFLATKDRIVVSSEPLDGGKWQDLGDKKFLEA